MSIISKLFPSSNPATFISSTFSGTSSLIVAVLRKNSDGARFLASKMEFYSSSYCTRITLVRLLFVFFTLLMPLFSPSGSFTDRRCSKNLTRSFTLDVLACSFASSCYLPFSARSSSDVKSTDRTSSSSSEEPSLDY